MPKSPDAFRTISEVADWLGIQAHVLRFWESKFTQVKPIKRAGGRRYYRPADMLLLGGIKKLLHDDGLTIKGVQKILREDGMSHVSDMSGPLDEATSAQLEEAAAKEVPAPVVETQTEEKGVVLSFEAREAEKEAETTAEPAQDPTPVVEVMQEPSASAEEQPPEAVDAKPAPIAAAGEVEPEPDTPDDVSDDTLDDAPESTAAKPVDPQPVATEPEHTADEAPSVDEAPAKEPEVALPAFLRRPLDLTPASEPSDNARPDPEPVEEVAPTPESAVTAPAAPPAPKPRVIDIAPITSEADFDVSQSVLTSAYRLRRSSPKAAQQIKPLLARLTSLRDGMAARRRGAGATPAKD